MRELQSTRSGATALATFGSLQLTVLCVGKSTWCWEQIVGNRGFGPDLAECLKQVWPWSRTTTCKWLSSRQWSTTSWKRIDCNCLLIFKHALLLTAEDIPRTTTPMPVIQPRVCPQQAQGCARERSRDMDVLHGKPLQ
eukprot:5238261-Amphidinium_carterae.1